MRWSHDPLIAIHVKIPKKREITAQRSVPRLPTILKYNTESRKPGEDVSEQPRERIMTLVEFSLLNFQFCAFILIFFCWQNCPFWSCERWLSKANNAGRHNPGFDICWLRGVTALRILASNYRFTADINTFACTSIHQLSLYHSQRTSQGLSQPTSRFCSRCGSGNLVTGPDLNNRWAWENPTSHLGELHDFEKILEIRVGARFHRTSQQTPKSEIWPLWRLKRQRMC